MKNKQFDIVIYNFDTRKFDTRKSVKILKTFDFHGEIACFHKNHEGYIVLSDFETGYKLFETDYKTIKSAEKQLKNFDSKIPLYLEIKKDVRSGRNKAIKIINNK